MKHAKKLLCLLLTLCMVIGMIPVVEATNEDFRCREWDYSLLEETYQNLVVGKEEGKEEGEKRKVREEYEDYVLAAIKYHIESGTGDYRIEKNLLQLYKQGEDGNVVFFFEGCSSNLSGVTEYQDNYNGPSGYKKGGVVHNTSALCIVIRVDSSEKPYVAFATENASTMPDQVRQIKQPYEHYSGHKNGVGCIKDGIYSLKTVNYRKHAALKLNNGGDIGSIRAKFDGITNLGANADGIFIHRRGFANVSDTYGYEKSSDSIGCLNVGNSYHSDTTYSDFIAATTGKTSGATSTYASDGKNIGCVVVDRSCYVDQLAKIYGDDNCENGKTGKQIANSLTKLSAVWHEDIENDMQRKILQITSPRDDSTVTFDHNKGLHINWTPVDGAWSYRISIRDLTSNSDDKGTHADGQFSVFGQNVNSYTVKELVYQAPNGNVSTAQFQNGHDYRIWVGAYDELGYPMTNMDQIEITLEIPEQEEPENPEETLPSDTPSRDIVLILDGSGSMSYDEFAMTKEAAEAFAEQVLVDGSTTRIAVMSFGSSNRLFKVNESDSGFYNTLNDVKAAIEKGTRDDGLTYMADALLYAESLLSGSTADKQDIVLMSDGVACGYSSEAASYGTEGSFADLDANVAYNVAKHLTTDNGYYIHTLGFGLYEGSQAELLLKEIAALTDRTYQAVTKVEDLKFAFEESAGDIILSDNQILIKIACPVEVYVSYGGEALSSSSNWPSYVTGFGSLSVSDDGEVKTLRLDASKDYNVEIFGTGDGTMTVTSKYPGAAKEEVVFEDVPVSTLMTAQFSTANSENTVMQYDGDGDGEYEDEIEGEKTFKGNPEFSVTYMADGEIHAVDTYTEGETIVPPEAPGNPGYRFVGWEGLPDVMPSEDIVVTAVWKKRSAYTTSQRLDGMLPADSNSFADVSPSDWFYEDVQNAWENDLIDGVTASEFRPNETLTVAQAIKLAAALHQLDTMGHVTLSNGDTNWYDTYVDYAVENGIIEDEYGAFTEAQMNAPVSRNEFVHIFHGAMSNYAQMNSVPDNAIPDVKLGDKYASEIYAFYRAGILTGNDGTGTFAPDSSIKRCEVAAILSRMYDSSARKSVSLG